MPDQALVIKDEQAREISVQFIESRHRRNPLLSFNHKGSELIRHSAVTLIETVPKGCGIVLIGLEPAAHINSAEVMKLTDWTQAKMSPDLQRVA